MNLKNFIDTEFTEKIFGKDADKISQTNKNIVYVSLFTALTIFIVFINQIFTFIVQNNFIISSLAVAVYIIIGIRKNNWFKGIQVVLLSTFFIVIFVGYKLSHASHFISQKKYSTYHSTEVGNEAWFNLEIKKDNTFEIEMSTPKIGYWGTKQKGKISRLSKQRYADNGKQYYCFYLEEFPYAGMRSMVSFDDAASDVYLKLNDKLYKLEDGIEENPWF